jgi:DegV family protein with EDD domain
MNAVRIMADSGCDVPHELAAKYNITIIPCMIRFGQETVWDAEMTPDEFWARQASSGQIPGTAAPAPTAFGDAFRRAIEAGYDVLCFTLPANFSGIYNSAWLASQEFGDHVRVLDSGSISVGMGVQVLFAAHQAIAGQNLAAIYRYSESVRRRTSVVFMLDSLEWVRRGGRMARLLPLIDRVARAFQVKPIFELINGDIHLLGVARSYRNAVQRVEDEIRTRMPAEALCTAYTRGRDAAAQLAGRLRALPGVPDGELTFEEAGPVFAAHAGPNALGAVLVRV